MKITIPNTNIRALQIYLILIGCAQRRQLITYGELTIVLGMDARAAQSIGFHLGRIKAYCERECLPELNLLVVNETTGKPGNGAAAANKDLPTEWHVIFRCRWFQLPVPTEAELQENTCGIAA